MFHKALLAFLPFLQMEKIGGIHVTKAMDIQQWLQWQLARKMLPLVIGEVQHRALVGPREGEVKWKTANMQSEPPEEKVGELCKLIKPSPPLLS